MQIRKRTVGAVVLTTAVLVSGLGVNSASAAPPDPRPGCLKLGKRVYDGYTIPTTVLSSGSRGVCVRYLQELLISHGFIDIVGTVDGIFGPKTRAAVVRIQGAGADGIVGKNTWRSLVILD